MATARAKRASRASGSVDGIMLVRIVLSFVVGVLLPGFGGCGYIADKDRIEIAVMEGESITRGDLNKLIREMPDEERPIIQTRGDLVRALNRHINDRIKAELAKELAAQEKIDVPREVARESYFEKHPEYRAAFAIQDPTQLDMTEGDIRAMRAEVEFGIDEEVERLLREQALLYKMREAMQTRSVRVTADELEREYQMRKDRLVRHESVEFIALQLPASMPNAIERAAEARRRIEAGESLDAILEEYMNQNPNFGTRSVLQNDPENTRFRPAWQSLHGVAKGDIVGPLLLPERHEIEVDEQGRTSRRTVPPSVLVLEVLEHQPARTKTIEEAQAELIEAIVRRKVLEQLRAARGVEVYPEKLPDPAGFGDQYEDYMIDTSNVVGAEN